MALMTGEQYIESIRKIPMEIYMFGEKVENPVDDPILRPSLNSVRMTYDLAQMPEYQELMTAVSPETGERINRFTHIHRSTEDLRNKVKMQRLLGQKTAACFQRCVGMDAFNAEYSTTYEIDKKYGTRYHENFKKFMLYCQENDLTVDGAMTDTKGDRSKPPHAQADPDLFLRVVERREDGVVVCGAKAHQTGIINSHEVIVMPTQSMGPDDKDYAISFAVPLDTQGLFMIIGRQSCDTRKREGGELDVAAEYKDGQYLINVWVVRRGETNKADLIVYDVAGDIDNYDNDKNGVTAGDKKPAAHVHNYTKTEAKAATCTAKGNKEYWSCKVDGCDDTKKYSDEAHTTELVDWEIDKLDHDYDGQTWQGNDTGDHTLACKNCAEGTLTHTATFADENTGTTCTGTNGGHNCTITHS